MPADSIGRPPEEDVSRRRLLRRLGAAAAGAGVAVGTSLLGAQPAAAGIDGDVVLGASNSAGASSTTLISSADNGTLSVFNNATTGDDSTNAVHGLVQAAGNPAAGIWGRTFGLGAGVRGSGGTLGVGLQGGGGRAQLRLVPLGVSGAPTTGVHDGGEVFVDAAGIMFHNVATGAPGRGGS